MNQVSPDFELILGDSLDWLSLQERHSLFIVTDPPIGGFYRELHDAAHTYIMMGGQSLLSDGERRIPGEKAMDAYLEVIRLFPYDIVVDPFMGTGTVGEAALLAGKSFIGVERTPSTFIIAQARLDMLTL